MSNPRDLAHVRACLDDPFTPHLLALADWHEENDQPALARADRDRPQSILDQPVVMLFADGREPTKNERHLASLLSWRMKEAEEAKAEIARLRATIEGKE